MTPIQKAIIEGKTSIILRELALLKRIKKQKISRASDIIFQHALCHSVQNLIAAVIDIAQHIVSETSDEIPNSYAEAIERLGDLKILSPKFAHEFSEIAKLRNVVVHAYEKLDIDRLAALLPRTIRDTEVFLKAIRKRFL